MRLKENSSAAVEARMLNTRELQSYIGLGRNNAMKFGEEAGAKVKLGKRVLWDKRKIDRYVDTLTKE